MSAVMNEMKEKTLSSQDVSKLLYEYVDILCYVYIQYYISTGFTVRLSGCKHKLHSFSLLCACDICNGSKIESFLIGSDLVDQAKKK